MEVEWFLTSTRFSNHGCNILYFHFELGLISRVFQCISTAMSCVSNSSEFYQLPALQVEDLNFWSNLCFAVWTVCLFHVGGKRYYVSILLSVCQSITNNVKYELNNGIETIVELIHYWADNWNLQCKTEITTGLRLVLINIYTKCLSHFNCRTSQNSCEFFSHLNFVEQFPRLSYQEKVSLITN